MKTDNARFNYGFTKSPSKTRGPSLGCIILAALTDANPSVEFRCIVLTEKTRHWEKNLWAKRESSPLNS